MKKTRKFLHICLAFLLTSISAYPQDSDTLPAYIPETQISGVIRIWGNRYMADVVQRWSNGFRRFHPEARFEVSLEGSDVAMPGIYSGLADIALMGRDSDYADKNGFFRMLQYNPLRIETTTGSLGVPGKSNALLVYVHKDNPLAKLTMEQLAAVFGCGAKSIRTWGQLGLTGKWADKPLNLYTYDIKTGTGFYFVNVVLKDDYKLNWERLREFKDTKKPNGTIYESGQQIIDALKKDRYGLAISGVSSVNPSVKAVALSQGDGGLFYQATRENLIARTYPLTRATYAFVNRPPGKPVEPRIKEFLRYVLSREGQTDVVSAGDYLPLNSTISKAQRQIIE